MKDLTEHQQAHHQPHDIKFYQCNICKNDFAELKDLELHIDNKCKNSQNDSIATNEIEEMKNAKVKYDILKKLVFEFLCTCDLGIWNFLRSQLSK